MKTTLKKKQDSLIITMTRLLNDFELTELELNTLYGLQGIILERILNNKSRKIQ
jgi:hypothetical protein